MKCNTHGSMSSYFYSLVILAVTVGLCALGCAEKKPTSAPATKVEPLESAVEEPSAIESEIETFASVELAAPVEEMSAHPEPLPERFVLLARGGPLLVDVVITLDGKPYDAALEAIVDQVLAAADTDEDGKPTWDEWRANTEFLEGDLANLTSMRERRVRDWLKRYDMNEDGRMQRGEAASWLGRDGGRSATGLKVRSSRSYVASAASRSRLWQILDVNADGQLSGVELDQASARLFLLDTSDDRIVDAAEMATLRDQISSQNGRRANYARQSRRDAAVRLSNPREARELDYLLSDLYAPRQDLIPESFPARRRLFDELDADGDQSLDASELEAMLSVEPHLSLAVEFTSKLDDEEPSATLRLIDHAAEIEHVRLNSKDQIILTTEDTRLVVLARDLGSGQLNAQAVQANQVSLMVHDQTDGLFECLDVDSSGRLGEREISFAAERIRASDNNGDQQLDGEELPFSLAVAFLRAEPPNERSFYVPPIISQATQDADTPTWFYHADLNADGDISRSEFLGTASQFESLDLNGDLFISADEALKFEAR